MAKLVDWDFALELKGVDPASLPMARLADYLTEWAALLGPEHRPVFKGLVKGSVVLRAAVPALDRVSTSARLRNAANEGDGARHLARLEDMLAADGLRRGKIVDRAGSPLLLILPAQPSRFDPVVVQDTVDVDGRVVRVEGRDRTSHIGLVESGTDRLISLQTANKALAQRLAQHYQGAWLRLHTRGPWVMTSPGRWEPKTLTVESFEVLDDTSAFELIQELGRMPGNGWAAMSPAEAMAAWRELRGIDDDAKEQGATL